MDFPPEVLELVGALALAVPLTASRVPKWIDAWNKSRTDAIRARADADAKAVVADAEAKRALAEADRLEAEAVKTLLARIDECEKKHDAQSDRATKLEDMVVHMQRQIDSDAVIIVRFSAKIEEDELRQTSDEKIIRGMQVELAELRKVVETGIRTGGRHA